jgi:hypothetical protein
VGEVLVRSLELRVREKRYGLRSGLNLGPATLEDVASAESRSEMMNVKLETRNFNSERAELCRSSGISAKCWVWRAAEERIARG